MFHLGMHHNAFLMVSLFSNTDDKPNEGPRFFYIPDNRERCGSDRAKIPSVLPPTDRKGQVQTELGTYSSWSIQCQFILSRGLSSQRTRGKI